MTDRPNKALIRQQLIDCERWMGTPRERRALAGKRGILQDAKIWHAYRRTGMGAIAPEECFAWAILYRAAYYGTLPIGERRP